MNHVSDINIEEIIPSLHRNLYRELLSECNEAILFGSYAMNVQTFSSDVDILFIGCEFEKKIKKKGIDFILLKEDNTQLNSWLGSELANHISKYGRWIKGNPNWTDHTFISKYTVNRKKIKIINRLAHIYVNKTKSRDILESFLIDVLLDGLRLIQLMNQKSVPPTILLKFILVNSKQNFFKILGQKKFLGEIVKSFFKEIGHDYTLNNNYSNILSLIVDNLRSYNLDSLDMKLKELDDDIKLYNAI